MRKTLKRSFISLKLLNFAIMRYSASTILMAFFAAFTALVSTSCVDEESYDNTPAGNLEALWRVMDEHYCFFDLKQKELGVDWNEVRQRYVVNAPEHVSRYQLFEMACRMIGELRDGHVNVSSPFDYGRNWSWSEDYPKNFSDTLQRKYLGTDYRMIGALKYRILDDNVGYIHCSSFEHDFGAGNLDEVFYYFSRCPKLILDMRNNGGGQIVAAETLAERFVDSDVLVGYMQHKTGPGHNEFSSLDEQVIHAVSRICWPKQVIVLTNRSVYSAANEFVKYMKAIGEQTHRVTIVGDRTGGGAGMPFSAELPNGWAVRFSACPMYDNHGNSTEQGIEPDYKVSLKDDDFQRGRDTIIEFARNL